MATALTAAALADQGGLGAYKEIATTTYSAETELRGTKQAPPASFPNYLPVWDKEIK
jgi:hypothetical protein